MLKKTLTILLSFMLFATSARAGDPDFSLIRDAEIEAYLHDLAAPIFYAARIHPSAVDLVIINNPEINAFVAGGQNIFFYTGLLRETKTAEELQGVIAHETGHIAGGHLVRGTKVMKNASTQAIIGMIAGLLAGIASGNGQVAMAGLSSAQQIAQRNLMSYSRAQESAADTAALSFLDQIGQSAEGFLSFMKTLEGQEYVPEEQRSAYARTHPMSKERIQNIEHHIELTQNKKKELPEQFAVQHRRMQAKLLGYLHPETAILRYTDKDKRPFARYARAIALYRKNEMERALTLMKGLLKEEPNNPFYHEQIGQILFEGGQIKDAIESYKQAVTLVPESALLRVAYAHAMIEGKDPNHLDEIINQLTNATQKEPQDPQSWRFLATAWHRQFEITKNTLYQGLVAYARTEEAVCMNEVDAAERYAKQAIDILPPKSPYWLRVQDIKIAIDKQRNH